MNCALKLNDVSIHFLFFVLSLTYIKYDHEITNMLFLANIFKVIQRWLSNEKMLGMHHISLIAQILGCV